MYSAQQIMFWGFGILIPILTLLPTFELVTLVNLKKLNTYLWTCMKFEPCAFSVSDTVTVSIDDILPLPEEF